MKQIQQQYKNNNINKKKTNKKRIRKREVTKPLISKLCTLEKHPKKGLLR